MTRRRALGTRVARRIVGLFLLCALLPVALVLAVSYERVQNALVGERIAQLGHAAESYGTTLLERLQLAEQLTRSIGAQVQPAAATDVALARYFRSIALVVPGALPRMLLGDASGSPAHPDVHAPRPHLAAGEAVLSVAAAAVGPRNVTLIRAIAPGEPGRGLRVAELNPDYLWGQADELPYLTSVCVLDAARTPLYCPEGLPEAALAQIRAQLASGPSGYHAWDAGGERHISSYREVFLEAKFRASSWPIIASQPEEHALAPTRGVQRLVVPVVVLGLLLAAFLGLIHVRRTMGPLAQLAEATQRIAAREFETRVPVARDDEFGELGHALNTMSERLGRQFHALGALAQIDSVILSKVDIDRIVAIVLDRMKAAVNADWRVLLLAEPAVPGSFRIHALEREPGPWHGPSLILADDDARRLAVVPDGTHIVMGDPAHHAFLRFAELGAHSLFTVPIVLSGRLAGLVALGYRDDRTPDPDEARLLRDLGDRVAVALQTAARDQALYRSAHYDTLTQLPNRAFFLDELARELARAERQSAHLGLLFIDLDGFSHVNDSLGHAAGDELLVHAAARLRACMRKADLVARLGGDEFTVVLPDLRDAADAATVAQHVIETLSQPYDIGHGESFVAASIGIALFPIDGTDPEELLRHADMAMYRAKAKGRASHAFFEEGMNREAQQRLALDRELRRAIDGDQFVLYYQPQLDLRTNRIVGAEALIRWLHPTRGLVAPGPFIGFAEETGLIERIGEWVLATACAQYVAWRRAGLPIDHVSVNVSPRQFRRKDFADQVAKAVKDSALRRGALRLEITESVLVDESGAVDAALARLGELGIPLELDDFGTGYSSLAYLQRLPVATIKLDRSFIRDIAVSDNARAIVRAAIAMVHALKKEIVAEGVETEAQLALLRAWGCDAVQGYHLSTPVPADRFVEFVRNFSDPAESARPRLLFSVAR
ncbi:MAG: putative bifunctional diguanylate cyclase/phosphodiesterase [Burkholderiales bacterium]